MKPLYLDNAATTPLHPQALAAMMPYLTDDFHNPSGVYAPARRVRKAIDEARATVAAAIGARPDEVYFTGSGTEADNWAIHGTLAANPDKRHIITTQVEHPGIRRTCRALQNHGYDITYLPVDAEGRINTKDLQSSLRPDTTLATIIYANNEVGTIQPMAQIAAIMQDHAAFLHTDAVQAVGHVPIDVNALGVDMLALSAHKFGGPKGVGALYLRKGTPITSFIHGGAQERGRRAGTENVAGIIGMATALTLSMEAMPTEQPRVTRLRDHLIAQILQKIPHTKLNGATHDRLPGNVNISFRFIEGESLLLHLDMNGCAASTGSACSSGSLEPSHVLMAMGLDHGLANGALRFSLGRVNTDEDVARLMALLEPTVARLRSMSPLYDDYVATRN